MKKGGDTVTVVVVFCFFEQTESVLEKAGSRLAVECDGDGMAIFESCQERGCTTQKQKTHYIALALRQPTPSLGQT